MCDIGFVLKRDCGEPTADPEDACFLTGRNGGLHWNRGHCFIMTLDLVVRMSIRGCFQGVSSLNSQSGGLTNTATKLTTTPYTEGDKHMES